MPGVLLDTYLIAELLNGTQTSISPAQRVALGGATGNIYASAISGLELALHERAGRVELKVPVSELGPELERRGIAVISIGWEEAALAPRVAVPHRDPFDRILVATALRRGLTLLTNDRAIAMCPGLSFIA